MRASPERGLIHLMRLTFITPLVNPDDPLLGFIPTWISAIAARVDHLNVIQLWKSSPSLPANVTLHSLDRDGPGGKAGVLARLASIVSRLCFTKQTDGVIAHMGPIFAVCSAPIARVVGIPSALWYAHGAVSPTLRLAHILVDRVGTSTPDGFRIQSDKVTITGQGIDTQHFTPGGKREPDLIISIGRLSPVKHHERLIDALAILRSRGLDARLRIVGGATLDHERAYHQELLAQIDRLGLVSAAEVIPGVPHSQIAAEYQHSTIFASCSETGSLDKSILEAAATGTVPVTSNPALAGFFGAERIEHMPVNPSPEAIADLLQLWLRRSPVARDERGNSLRARVVELHGVEHLADEMVRLVTSAVTS
jgi:glycosyltransferase involved in cell wall biosynthesis